MTYSLTWLPDVLKNAGLKVAEVPGWKDRGRGDVGRILGVICHHTAGARSGNMPSLRVLVEGRSDLQGPLSQLGLGRDGTFYVIAAGRCNHAGEGYWNGSRYGNTNFIGIEAENTGKGDDNPWPEIQLDAYRRGVAAILAYLGLEPGACAGHKEYALPRGRKNDPNFDMEDFRTEVARIMGGDAPPPRVIPAAEPSRPGGAPGRKTLRRGFTGADVSALQAKLNLDADGYFGPRTEAAVRQFQRDHGLVPDGIVGPKTWQVL